MKRKFIKSTLLLLIGGFITKLLGLIIKVYLSRILHPKALGLYMLILPTFLLVINLSQFSFPLALAKLISEGKRNNKRLVLSVMPLVIIINIIIILSLILLAPIISNHLLKQSETYPGILAIALVVPFTTISSICRSYFFGKEKLIPHIVSNIIESISRLLILFIIGNYFINLDYQYTVCILILLNIVSEVISTIILIIFIPKGVTITKKDLYPKREYIKDSLEICIPNTTNQFIASIGYFLEPIILTYCLLKTNYSIHYITYEYGILSGYVIPLILLPSFFTQAISTALLPTLAREYSNKNYKKVKSLLLFSLIISIIIGITTTIIFILKANQLLLIFYHTNRGISYLKIMAPIFLLQYIQAPLFSYLNAINESNTILKSTIIGTISRIIILFLFSKFRIGIWSLVIAISINIVITSIYLIKKVIKHL